jgi:hypothetical protein
MPDGVLQASQAREPSAGQNRPSGQIREIPISQEVLTRSTAREMADPPRFPKLK